MKARGVGEMMARVGACCGASVVTSSDRDWVSRVRRAGMIVRRGQWEDDNGGVFVRGGRRRIMTDWSYAQGGRKE